MDSSALKWFTSLEKLDADGIVKSIRSFCALLKLKPDMPLPHEVKMSLINRIKRLLMHDSVDVVQSTVVLLDELTAQSPELPSELTMALMEHAASVLRRYNTGQHNFREHASLVCEMLCTLALFNKSEMICFSGCLKQTLYVFDNIHISKNLSVEDIIWPAVDVILCALSDTKGSRKEIGYKVIPKVVGCLDIWLDNYEPEISIVLKELLFVGRQLISGSEECQNMFLQSGGLDSLVSVLIQSDRMKEHSEIVLPPPKNCFHTDVSPTLFASIVLLLEAAVTHNTKACERASKLSIIEILKQYLSVSDAEQQVIVVTAIVHLLEAEIENPSPWTASLIREMYFIVRDKPGCSIDVLSFLQSHQHFEQSKRKCTPHSNKKLSLQRNKTNQELQEKNIERFKGTPHPNKKALKRLSPDNKQKMIGFDPPLEEHTDKCKVSVHELDAHSQSNSLSQMIPLPETQLLIMSRTTERKYFISIAELVLLVQCIKKHGVNMNNVRRAWRFHPELTPDELYALWRSLWPKSGAQRFKSWRHTI